MSDWFAGTQSGDEEYSRQCDENDRRAREKGYRNFTHQCDEERQALSPCLHPVEKQYKDGCECGAWVAQGTPAE